MGLLWGALSVQLHLSTVIISLTIHHHFGCPISLYLSVRHLIPQRGKQTTGTQVLGSSSTFWGEVKIRNCASFSEILYDEDGGEHWLFICNSNNASIKVLSGNIVVSALTWLLFLNSIFYFIENIFYYLFLFYILILNVYLSSLQFLKNLFWQCLSFNWFSYYV